jgi:hypothetical protein
MDTDPDAASDARSCGDADSLAGCVGLESREGDGETKTHPRREEKDPDSMSPPSHTIPLDPMSLPPQIWMEEEVKRDKGSAHGEKREGDGEKWRSHDPPFGYRRVCGICKTTGKRVSGRMS